MKSGKRASPALTLVALVAPLIFITAGHLHLAADHDCQSAQGGTENCCVLCTHLTHLHPDLPPGWTWQADCVWQPFSAKPLVTVLATDPPLQAVRGPPA